MQRGGRATEYSSAAKWNAGGVFRFLVTTLPCTLAPMVFSTYVNYIGRSEANFTLMCSTNGMFEVTQSCVDVNDCPDNDCGKRGDCVDLPNVVGKESINHFECDCQPGSVEVLTETLKGCEDRNGSEVCEDDLQRNICECVGTSSCYSRYMQQSCRQFRLRLSHWVQNWGG